MKHDKNHERCSVVPVCMWNVVGVTMIMKPWGDYETKRNGVRLTIIAMKRILSTTEKDRIKGNV